MATNQTKRKSGWAIASAVTLASNMFGLVVLTITTTLEGARAAEIYRDMLHTRLPQITETLLNTVSPTAYLGTWGAIAAVLLAKEFLIRDKLTTFKINIAGIAFLLIFLAVYVFAICYPMFIMAGGLGT